MTSAKNPIARGHHPRDHPRACPGWSFTPRCSPTRTAPSSSRPGTQAERGELDPFVLILEGSLPNEEINGEGHFAGMGVNPETGQPITTNEWVDRLAPEGGRGRRRRHLRDLRRHPGDEEQPDRRDGPARLPRLELEVEGRDPDRLHPGLPGAARQHDGDAALPRAPARRDGADDRRSTTRCGRGGSSGAPCARTATAAASPRWGNFATEYGDDSRCLVKLGCKGPVVKCNVPVRGWQSGIGGCPNVGGICMACTMPGFPDKYMPFMDEDPWGGVAANVDEYTIGPLDPLHRKRTSRKVRQGARSGGARAASSAPATARATTANRRSERR